MDYLTSFLGIFFSSEYQLLLMFLSAFLSATVLPGNSEILFGTLATEISLRVQLFSWETFWLWAIATLGNSLGSLTTYFIARLLPELKYNQTSKMVQWSLRYSQKYGAWILLFSWLPLVGDILCGIAGWLRFDLRHTLIFITLGKAIRYAILLWGIYLIVG